MYQLTRPSPKAALSQVAHFVIKGSEGDDRPAS